MYARSGLRRTSILSSRPTTLSMSSTWGCALTSSPLNTGGLLHLHLLYEVFVGWEALSVACEKKQVPVGKCFLKVTPGFSQISGREDSLEINSLFSCQQCVGISRRRGLYGTSEAGRGVGGGRPSTRRASSAASCSTRRSIRCAATAVCGRACAEAASLPGTSS